MIGTRWRDAGDTGFMPRRVEHRLDWGVTPKTRKRYAVCSCGWRAPARTKLTHGLSDVRDHLADVKAKCAEQGWKWWMVKPLGLVTEEPDSESGMDHGVSSGALSEGADIHSLRG